MCGFVVATYNYIEKLLLEHKCYIVYLLIYLTPLLNCTGSIVCIVADSAEF
jgi:hypothetical protein